MKIDEESNRSNKNFLTVNEHLTFSNTYHNFLYRYKPRLTKTPKKNDLNNKSSDEKQNENGDNNGTKEYRESMDGMIKLEGSSLKIGSECLNSLIPIIKTTKVFITMPTTVIASSLGSFTIIYTDKERGFLKVKPKILMKNLEKNIKKYLEYDSKYQDKLGTPAFILKEYIGGKNTNLGNICHLFYTLNELMNYTTYKVKGPEFVIQRFIKTRNKISSIFRVIISNQKIRVL